LARELEDLKETCEAIRASHRRFHVPSWLIIAVDKIDLYYDKLSGVRFHYAPNGSSEFVHRIQDLVSQVGSDFLRWETVPVCGCLDRFEWNGKALAPQIDEEKRKAYLAQFLRVIESYSN
jgi:hypothetical protein